MDLVAIALLVTAGAAAAPSAPANALAAELIHDGVAMSDGSRLKLPPPTLADSLDAAGQRAAIAKLLEGTGHAPDELTRNSYQAPFVLNVRTVRGGNPKAPARSIDLWFIAHGDWATATSQEFLDSFWKASKARSDDPLPSRHALLTAAELAQRKIEPRAPAGSDERYVFGAANLFDRVYVSATQRSLVTRYPARVLLAQQIDPRFNQDATYPNQWRPISFKPEGKMELGSPHPYVQAASWGQAVALAEPAGAILFEFHMLLEEPEAWFGGVNLLSSKLPLAARDQIRSFRRRLAGASPKRP